MEEDGAGEVGIAWIGSRGGFVRVIHPMRLRITGSTPNMLAHADDADYGLGP